MTQRPIRCRAERSHDRDRVACSLCHQIIGRLEKHRIVSHLDDLHCLIVRGASRDGDDHVGGEAFVDEVPPGVCQTIVVFQACRVRIAFRKTDRRRRITWQDLCSAVRHRAHGRSDHCRRAEGGDLKIAVEYLHEPSDIGRGEQTCGSSQRCTAARSGVGRNRCRRDVSVEERAVDEIHFA